MKRLRSTICFRQGRTRCVIYGAGTLGRKAATLLREIGCTPLALVDSNSQCWGSDVSGLPVLSPAAAAEQFGSNAVFFGTIWNDFHWYSDTRRKLIALGCKSVSSYAPIFWRFGDRFMDLLLLNEPAHRLYEDLDRVLEAESIWADEESLATYRANILWRALGDPSYLPYPAPQIPISHSTSSISPPTRCSLTAAHSTAIPSAFCSPSPRTSKLSTP